MTWSGQTPGAAGGVSLPTGVSSIALMNDYSIPVTTPLAQNVPVPMNGRALRLVTNAAASSYDPTKVVGTVTRKGFTTAAAPTTYVETVNFSQRIRRPSTNESQFSLDINGSDYVFGALDLAPDATIYAQDTLSLTFTAGFVTGSGAGSVTNAQITRNDSRPYRMPVGRPVSEPYGVYRGTTNAFEVVAACDSPRAKSLLAAVRAFLIDKNGTKGNVSTTGTMVVSADADGTFSGLKGWCYRPNLDTTGLVDGAGQVIYQLVPWIGDTIADSRTFGEAWPTISYPKSLPCMIDNANNFTPLYALVSQAKTGLTGTSTAGLCATEAGAIAAAAPYQSEKDAALAMKLANNTGTGGTAAVTILSDNGLSTKSFTRTTAHNDCDALVISLAVVAGSAAQFGVSATGSYTWTVPAAQATCPITAVPITIKSASGGYDDGVRYTGGASLTLANKIGFRLCIFQGITFDSNFTTTGTDMICVYGSTAGNPTSLPTPAAAVVTMTRDCRIRKPGSGASGALHQMGYTKHTRLSITGENTLSGLGVTPGAFAGNFGWTNSILNNCGTGIVPAMVLGCRLVNTPMQTQGNGVQPNINGLVAGNFEIHANALTSSPLQIGANRPVRDALLYNYLIRQTTAGTSPNVSISADGAITTTVNLIDIGRTSAGQRSNVNYSDQGYLGIGTDVVVLYPVDEQYNTKHDAYTAPENPSISTPRPAIPYVSGSYYDRGAIITDMTAITAISGSGSVVTATVGVGHGVNIGDQVVVSGVATTVAYNGTFTVTAVTATTIAWAAATTGTGAITVSTTFTANSRNIYQAIRDIPATATLDSVAVTAGGSGYTYATVALTGGGATRQATANAVLSAGVVIGLLVVDPGTGYTSNPTVTITGDGTGATASGVYCASAIALTNTAYFANAATLYGTNQWNTSYGEKSLRTDNWGCRFHIDHKGKVCRHSFNDAANVNGTFGEVGPSGAYFGRDGQLKAYTSGVGWYVRNTASSGTEAAFKDPTGTNVVAVNPTAVTTNVNPANDFGDFTPVAGSGPCNRIAAGYAPYPQDSYGNAYRNDGTDAAGSRNN